MGFMHLRIKVKEVMSTELEVSIEKKDKLFLKRLEGKFYLNTKGAFRTF